MQQIASFEDVVAEVEQLVTASGMTRPVRCVYRPDVPLEKTAESLIHWSITFGDALRQLSARHRRVVLAHEVGHLQSRPVVVLAIAGYLGLWLEAVHSVVVVDGMGFILWSLAEFAYLWVGQLLYELWADRVAAKHSNWRDVHDVLARLPPFPFIGRGLRVRCAKWMAERV